MSAMYDVGGLDQILQIKNITCVSSGCTGSDAQQTRISHTTTSTTTKRHRRQTAFTIRFRSCHTRFTGLCACSSRVRVLRTGSVLSVTFGSIIANVQYCLLHHTHTPTRPCTAPSQRHRNSFYHSIPTSFARPSTAPSPPASRGLLLNPWHGECCAEAVCSGHASPAMTLSVFIGLTRELVFQTPVFTAHFLPPHAPCRHVCFTVRAMIVGNWGKSEGHHTLASVIMCCKWWSRSWRGKCLMAH
jgi:hypothetical protein